MEVEWRRKGLGGDGGGDDCRTGRGVGGFEGVEEDQFFFIIGGLLYSKNKKRMEEEEEEEEKDEDEEGEGWSPAFCGSPGDMILTLRNRNWKIHWTDTVSTIKLKICLCVRSYVQRIRICPYYSE